MNIERDSHLPHFQMFYLAIPASRDTCRQTSRHLSISIFVSYVSVYDIALHHIMLPQYDWWHWRKLPHPPPHHITTFVASIAHVRATLVGNRIHKQTQGGLIYRKLRTCGGEGGAACAADATVSSHEGRFVIWGVSPSTDR